MIKHWLAIVSLLLLLPIEANGTIVSDRQVVQCKPETIAVILGQLAAECADEQTDIDTDVLFQDVTADVVQRCWSPDTALCTGFSQPRHYTLSIRAPPRSLV
ncbi:hypothetical protein [Salinimonas chungwhensis]|uniref:hypothetical protein n=1 Tax=Salinimonas chungwhensis TaxID=265425 RepID=UPI00037A75BA|nr:hypothetical protein [Salinimonas chungwhensis]